MKKYSNGFGIIGIVAIVVIVGVIGLTGWKAWETFSKNQTANNSKNDTASKTEAPAVNKVSDLTTAETVLDSTNIEGTEPASINTEINF